MFKLASSPVCALSLKVISFPVLVVLILLGGHRPSIAQPSTVPLAVELPAAISRLCYEARMTWGYFLYCAIPQGTQIQVTMKGASHDHHWKIEAATRETSGGIFERLGPTGQGRRAAYLWSNLRKEAKPGPFSGRLLCLSLEDGQRRCGQLGDSVVDQELGTLLESQMTDDFVQSLYDLGWVGEGGNSLSTWNPSNVKR